MQKQKRCFWCGKEIHHGGIRQRVGKTGRAPLHGYHKVCWREAKASLIFSKVK